MRRTRWFSWEAPYERKEEPRRKGGGMAMVRKNTGPDCIPRISIHTFFEPYFLANARIDLGRRHDTRDTTLVVKRNTLSGLGLDAPFLRRVQ